jgi:DNA-binding MarR family transcriptional regulator
METKMDLTKREADSSMDLERLESGELDVAQARLLLRALVGSMGHAAAAEAYASLRSWTGRLLRGSPGSEELRAWYNLIRATAAQFRGEKAEFGLRIGVLGELVYERVGMAETRRPSDVLKRRHVRAVLAELAASSGTLARSELGRRLALEQANLTRVCTMLIDAGLVTRREEGRSVFFELTAHGAALTKAADARTAHPAPIATPEDAEEWTAPKQIEVAGDASTDEVDAFGRYDDMLPMAA